MNVTGSLLGKYNANEYIAEKCEFKYKLDQKHSYFQMIKELNVGTYKKEIFQSREAEGFDEGAYRITNCERCGCCEALLDHLNHMRKGGSSA